MRQLSFVAALAVALLPGSASANRAEAMDWLERAIAQEARVQAAFLEVAFNGHSGDLPVPDGGGQPYYDPIAIGFVDEPGEASRDDWVAALERSMEAASLHELEIQFETRSDRGTVRFPVPFGRGVRLEGLSVAVIAAGEFIAEPELRGVEIDLIAGGEDGRHWMTGLHELDGRLVLRVTDSPPAALGPAPSSEDLSRRFGIGPLVDGDASWSPRERAALANALAQVPEPDLAVIAGLPFLRYVDPPPDHPDAAAFYRQEGAERSVNCFDAAFEGDEDLFVGEPHAPFDYTVRVVVHEIGHAVAYEKPYNAIHGLVARFEALSLLYEHLGELSVGGVRSERERLLAVLDQLQDLKRPLGRFRQALAGGTLQSSPVLTAFVEANGGRGPTTYGKTKLSEAFAESYMLFLLDPRALARVDPAALAFFESGAYQLEPLRVEPVPEVPQSVRDYLAIPEDEALVDELDSLLEDEIGPLD